jgi:hypothetical protein
VHNVATLLTPEDDHTTIFYFIAWNGADKPGIGAEAWRKFNVLEWSVDVDANFDGHPHAPRTTTCRTAPAMKAGNFTGIAGIPNQDIAMWEGMGPISDRSNERIGASDVAVVAFRRLMVEAARAMQNGEPAIGTTNPRVPHATISSYEGVVPKSVNWRTLGGGSEQPRERVPETALNKRKSGGRTMKARTIACALAFALLGGAASAQDTVKLAIGQRGNWDTSVSEVGQRAGIFKKHGLTLDIVYTQGAGETQQAVISGSVDIGVAAGVMGVLSAYSKGAPVRVIAAETTGAGDLYWYVKGDSPIKTLKDTDGKTLAYSTNGSSTHGVVTAFMKQYDLKQS